MLCCDSYINSFSGNLSLLVVPVSDGTHHSALRPERAGVQEVVALSRHEGEVKPLEQLGHHHFSLHLQPPIVLISCVTFTRICVMLFFFFLRQSPPT